MLKVLLESNVVLRSVGRGKRRDVVFGSSNALLKVSIATETEHEKVTLDKGDAYGTYDECLVPLLPSMPVHSPPVDGNFYTSPENVLVNVAFNFFFFFFSWTWVQREREKILPGTITIDKDYPGLCRSLISKLYQSQSSSSPFFRLFLISFILHFGYCSCYEVTAL